MPREDDHRTTIEQLYREHAPLVRRFLQSRCGSPELAADLTAITFEQAFQRVCQGRADEVTPAWLFAVARRRLIDHWRRTDRASAALDRLAESETRRRADGGLDLSIIDALRRMRPVHSRSLYLKYVLDRPTAVVAEDLGVSYRAAESTLRRARVALRELLDPDLDHAPQLTA